MYENASIPMVMTLSGMVTEVRSKSPEKALDWMATTGKPLMRLGMLTAPPLPL
jgi:hypothetical protein